MGFVERLSTLKKRPTGSESNRNVHQSLSPEWLNNCWFYLYIYVCMYVSTYMNLF